MPSFARGIEREWYPSGPIIGKSHYDVPIINKVEKNLPDPKMFEITKTHEEGGFLVLMVNYPNCSNYEGNKILVYQSTLLDIVNQKVIEPHFFEHSTYISPIARFVPTQHGWAMALKFIKVMICNSN